VLLSIKLCKFQGVLPSVLLQRAKLPMYYIEVENMVYNLANTIEEMNQKALEKGIKEGP